MKKEYMGIAHNKVTLKAFYTKKYDNWVSAYNAAKKLAKRIPAENAFIVVVDENGERVA